jgi:hypothetical protein
MMAGISVHDQSEPAFTIARNRRSRCVGTRNQEIARAAPPTRIAESSAPEDPAFERHYRIGELAAKWQLGRETVRLLVKDERGVIKIRLGRKKAHTIYSVPESVAVRIHTRLLNSR